MTDPIPEKEGVYPRRFAFVPDSDGIALIDEDNSGEWVYYHTLSTLQDRVRELEQALRQLANEASGFRSMADPFRHGRTNIAILGLRIDEARAALHVTDKAAQK